MKIINNLPQLLDVQRQLDNIDFLLGTHDVSHIGDGTITGTICSLSEKLSDKSDTSHNHDSRYLQKTAVINNTTVTEAGYALDARQANPNISGSLGAQITSLNETFTKKISGLNTNLENKVANDNNCKGMCFMGGTYASGSFPHIILPDGYTSDNSVILSFGVYSNSSGQWHYNAFPIALYTNQAIPQWAESPSTNTNNLFRLVLLRVK